MVQTTHNDPVLERRNVAQEQFLQLTANSAVCPCTVAELQRASACAGKELERIALVDFDIHSKDYYR